MFSTAVLFYFLAGLPDQPQNNYRIFKWHWEPNEKAFKIPLPQNWITEGRIFRINPTAGGGAANALEAKLDFSIKAIVTERF